MNKIVVISGQKFIRGKSQCTECDAKIKFTITVEAALLMPECLMLCKGCYWIEMDWPDKAKMTIRELIL